MCVLKGWQNFSLLIQAVYLQSTYILCKLYFGQFKYFWNHYNKMANKFIVNPNCQIKLLPLNNFEFRESITALLTNICYISGLPHSTFTPLNITENIWMFPEFDRGRTMYESHLWFCWFAYCSLFVKYALKINLLLEYWRMPFHGKQMSRRIL